MEEFSTKPDLKTNNLKIMNALFAVLTTDQNQL